MKGSVLYTVQPINLVQNYFDILF